MPRPAAEKAILEGARNAFLKKVTIHTDGACEMGEDALRVLRECLKIRTRIRAEVAAELPHVRAAVKWVRPFAKNTAHAVIRTKRLRLD